MGIPRLTNASINSAREDIKTKAQQKPEQQAPGNDGSVGVNDKGLYYAPREVITLSDSRPLNFAQFSDPVIADDSSRLRQTWLTAIQQDYSDAAFLLQEFDGNEITLDETFFQRWFRRSVNRAQETASQTAGRLPRSCAVRAP